MAVTVLEPAQVPGTFQQAFHLMRSGRPGPVLIDLPIDVQHGRDRVRPRDLRSRCRPTSRRATRAQVEKALDMLDAAERPLIVAGGGIINADAADLLVEFAELTGVPVVPDADGLGHHPRRPPARCRHGRAADLAPLRQRHHARSPTSCSASATGGPTGTPAASTPTRRAAPSCTSTSSRRRSGGCSHPTTASSPTPRPPSSCSSRWPRASRRRLPDRAVWAAGMPAAQADDAA